MRVAEALASYLQRSGLGERLAETSALDEWPGRVGDRIARVTTPLHVANGVLFVAVSSSAWLMELRLMEREVRRRLNAGKDRGRIDRIRFVMTADEEPHDGSRRNAGER